jgi:hypothetical protein
MHPRVHARQTAHGVLSGTLGGRRAGRFTGPVLRAVDDSEDLFAGRKAALASNGKHAARIGPDGVDAASIVAFQMFAALVGA